MDLTSAECGEYDLPIDTSLIPLKEDSMPLKHNICEGCGLEFQARRQDTKYCRGCRFLARVTDADKDGTAEWLTELRTCEECKHYFWPLRPTYVKCYYCMDARCGRRTEVPACTTCRRHNALAPGYLSSHTHPQCEACVARSAKARGNYFKRLFDLRAHRRECAGRTVGQFQTDETMPERPRTTTAAPAPITGPPAPPLKAPIPSEYRRAITNKADLERLLSCGHLHYQERYHAAAQKLKLLTEQYGPSSDYLWV